MPEPPDATDPDWIFIDCQGHRIACLAHEVEGATRTPVVWVHGLTASARFWETSMFPELVEGRSWYSISLPAHAPSTFRKRWKPFRMNEDLLAELLREPIEQLIPDGRFHLVGHSLGGFAALNCAAKFPDRVESVVAIGSFLTGRAKGLEKMLQFFVKGSLIRPVAFFLGYRFLKLHWKILALVSLFYANRRFRLLSNPAFRRTVQSIFPDVKKHPIRQQRLLIRSLIDMDLFDEVEEIRCPVLMVVGMADPVIPADHQIEAAEKLKNVTVARFETSGHLPFGESPEEFVEVLAGWLG